jgi:isocitrate lyase
MAKYDFGIATFEEFGRMTPGMFMALQKRHAVQFKHDCYLGGIGASATLNSRRQKDTDKIWDPFDFVPDAEQDTRRAELKRNVTALFAMLMSNPNTNKDAVRTKIIAKLTKAGHTNVSEVFDEVFASWKKDS